MIQRYRSRISGPLLDRIDIYVEVPAVKYRELTTRTRERPRQRFKNGSIRPARCNSRYAGTRIFCNAQMGTRELHQHCQVEATGERLLERAINRLGLSARAYTRILNVARTCADLDRGGPIEARHVSEAIPYRPLDRPAA